MSNNKSYITYSFWIALIVIVMLFSATIIPRVEIGEYKTKKINIISDIITFEEDSIEVKDKELVLDTTFMVNTPDSLPSYDSLSSGVDSTASPDSVEVVEHTWSMTTSKTKPSAVKNRGISNIDTTSIYIEEYDTIVSPSSVSEFYAKLKDSTETDIRVAFFGDSFIEGDLFTADVRELLQSKFLGRGVGFVPITSMVSQFRGSVKHTFKGWSRHSLLKPKSIPEELKDKFYVSGELFEAMDGATVRYEGVNYREYLNEFSLARFIFMNRGESTINVIINDTISQSFTPKTSDKIQKINITGDIKSIEIKIDNPEGFIGYGVVLEDGVGAVVDNYSLRGNSGLSICGSSHAVNRQINESLKYDLIVLQYGLNILTAEVSDYRGYARLMCRVVDHVKRSFPSSSIILMGVSDRSIQVEGEFITMPTLRSMITAQRSVADSCGIAFWSTFQAMGGENSMVDFVNKKWGAKDYTHFSQAGGKFLAKKFVSSLFMGAKNSSTKVRYDYGADSTLINNFHNDSNIKRVVHTPISYNISPIPVRHRVVLKNINI